MSTWSAVGDEVKQAVDDEVSSMWPYLYCCRCEEPGICDGRIADTVRSAIHFSPRAAGSGTLDLAVVLAAVVELVREVTVT